MCCPLQVAARARDALALMLCWRRERQLRHGGVKPAVGWVGVGLGSLPAGPVRIMAQMVVDMHRADVEREAAAG